MKNAFADKHHAIAFHWIGDGLALDSVEGVPNAALPVITKLDERFLEFTWVDDRGIHGLIDLPPRDEETLEANLRNAGFQVEHYVGNGEPVETVKRLEIQEVA